MPVLKQPCNNCCDCDFYFGDLFSDPGGTGSHDITADFLYGAHNVRIVANPDVTVTSYRVYGTVGGTSFDTGTLAYPTVYDNTVNVAQNSTTISYTVTLTASGSNTLLVEFECPA